jgi:hypothetical protein
MKNIITVAIAIIFVTTALFAVFNGGRLIQVGLNRALDTGYCSYVEKDRQEVCGFDSDKAKRDVAEAAAIFIVTLPVALLTFRRIRKQYDK